MSTETVRRTVLAELRSVFGRGIVLLMPVVITVWVLMVVWNSVDGVMSWLFVLIFKKQIPGLGFIATIALIMIVGTLSRNLIGQAVLRVFERVISTIPLARNIYSAMKDLIAGFKLGGKAKSFQRVVIIEYPRPGLFTVGFETNAITVRDKGETSEVLCVYIPNPPNPTSGQMVLVPKAGVRVLDMTVEDGLKLSLSGGIVTTDTISVK